MTEGTVRRGDIWVTDIPGDKRRPVVILTRDSFIDRLNNVTVAPVVSRVRDIPTEVVIDEDHGVDHRSAASFDNIITISKRNLIRQVGTLTPVELNRACAALRLALGC